MKYEWLGKVKTVKELVDLLTENAVDEDATVTASGAECNVILGYDQFTAKSLSITFEDDDYADLWNEELDS